MGHIHNSSQMLLETVTVMQPVDSVWGRCPADWWISLADGRNALLLSGVPTVILESVVPPTHSTVKPTCYTCYRATETLLQ